MKNNFRTISFNEIKATLGMIGVDDYLYIFEQGFIIRKDNNGASIQQSRVH